MNKRLALKILGVGNTTSFEDIRKKYKALMILTHPDMGVNHEYPFDASDINAAYEYLLEHYVEEEIIRESKEAKTPLWNAPVNENAYTQREILGYAESSAGDIHGHIHIATGKYTWTEDEDFSLFLLSIYNCSKKIIDEVEIKRNISYSEEKKEVLHAQIAYLLAGQFVDPYIFLEKYKYKELYKIPSMLEYTGNVYCKAGESVFPMAIRNHRLYIQNEKRKELGYLSFKDDRLYYCLIPLFEEKRVLLKMEATSVKPLKSGQKRYSEMALYLLFKEEDAGTMIDSINLKIDNLLK